MKTKVGKDNIIAAVVHMDEVNPHMHLSFCPTTADKLRDKIHRNEDGIAEQGITIFCKFVGSLHEFYIPMPKRICVIEEKACSRCG